MRPNPKHSRAGLTAGLLALGLAAAAPSAHAQAAPAFQVTQNFNGGFTLGVNDNFIPPDTMGAVGPTQFGELINGGYAVFSKTGGLVSRTTDQNFWNAAGVGAAAAPGVFDPRIQYDASSGHWFASELASSTSAGNINNQLLVAVSKTSDLTQGFNGFAFNTFSGTSQNFFADFDTLGVNSQGVYVGLNDFTSAGAGTAVSFLAIDKASLISSATSSTPTSTLFYDVNPNTTGFTPHPVTDTSTDTTEYLLSDGNTPAGVQSVSTITGTTGQLNAGGGNVSVTGYSGPPDASQLGSTALISSGDTRFSGAVVKVGGIIYGTQSVQDPTSGLDDIRLVGINATTKATVLDQLISSPSLNYYYPSVAVDASGKVIIGFSSSGPSQYASGDVLVGQLNAAGSAVSFSGPTALAPGQGSYNVTFGGTENRWGDYSSTTADPTDPNSFWTIQEYASATNQWSTNISEITLGSPSAAPEPSQLAGLGFAAAGVLGLLGRARRRKAAGRGE